MNTPAHAVSEAFDQQRTAPAILSSTNPFFWSLRREFWENRFLYLAPLSVGGVFLLGFCVTLVRLPAKIRALSGADPMHFRNAVGLHYDIAAGAMMATGIIVTVFYCLDAMYGERRDRSLLFWKSLPVSDWTAVLAKVSIPLLLLPLLVFLVAVAMQWVMVLFSTAVLLASGVSIAPMWRALSLPNMWGLMLYHMIAAHALWPAPFYCWLLFVSAWARRAPFLWATLPLVVVALVEKVALGSSHFLSLVAGRFIGNASAVTAMQGDMFPTNPMTHITPGAFLSNPGLWIGLLIAAAFVAAAVHLRRSQGPL